MTRLFVFAFTALAVGCADPDGACIQRATEPADCFESTESGCVDEEFHEGATCEELCEPVGADGVGAWDCADVPPLEG